MSDPAAARAQKEAAAWFARLSRLSVTTDTLKAFQRWKRQEANALAYEQIEGVWTGAADLHGDGDIQAATRAALARAAAPPEKKRKITAGIVLGGAILASLAMVGFWRLAPLAPTYATHVGEQRLVVLQDGSRVRLNTDSRIRVRYSPGRRDITLARGEAFFEVAHNPDRPFVVTADGAQVRALGTRFDVRRDAGAVQVTLLQGRVQVSDQRQGTATLAPNQQLKVTDQGLSAPHAADAATTAGWTSGRLTFRAIPLRTAIAEVNRYTTHKIVLDASPAAAAAPVSGVFDAGDTKAFVAAVTTLFDLHASPTADGGARLTQPPPGGPAAPTA